MEGIEFQAFGVPAPQGSKRAIPRKNGTIALIESSSKVKPWRESVLWAAREVMDPGHEPLQGPLGFTITFWLPRPKSRSKTIDVLPFVVPDLDKLLRSTFDAIKDSGMVHDDAQFVFGREVAKRYSVGPETPKIHRPLYHQPPGAQIKIWRIE